MVNVYKMLRSISVMVATLVLIGGQLAAQDAMLVLINSKTAEKTELSEEQLMALAQAQIETENEWVDSMTLFEGPLARDIMALMGLGVDDTVMLTAVNDYSIEVPVADFFEYDVVFAHSSDGVRLSLRDKGPIWVVYPTSANPELQDPTYNTRMIWQLVSVEAK